MTRKNMTPTARQRTRATVTLQIELPALSDEAAAAMADILVQLYHRFEATYYAQILSHHAQRAVGIEVPAPGDGNPQRSLEPF
jgi:hypothetical protein